MEKDTKAAENEVVKEDEIEEDRDQGEDSFEEEEKVEPAEGLKNVNVLTLTVPESTLKMAIDVLFTNTFGNQANKKIYALQKEIQKHIDEYNHLRTQLTKDPLNVEGEKFSKAGMKQLLELNQTVGAKQIQLGKLVPVEVQFLDCFSSNDRVVLESMGIAVFED